MAGGSGKGGSRDARGAAAALPVHSRFARPHAWADIDPPARRDGSAQPSVHGSAELEPVLRSTERLAPISAGIDTCSGAEALARLLAGQMQAARCVEAAIPLIDQAVDLAFAALDRGGRLVYLAAGSPALIALADCLEIPQTFGESPERFITVLAGQDELTTRFGGASEDDADAAVRDIAGAGIGRRDCVVAVSASGSTPYVVAGLAAARDAGASSVAIASNEDAPILRSADVAILLDTGPEIVAGSTRMGAGTAQKIVLNMLSTAIAIRRGHVHDGHMVALRADNAKLRERAIRMIGDCAGVSRERAAEALNAGGGQVKPAVLLAAGAGGLPDATARLERAGGSLRKALGDLRK